MLNLSIQDKVTTQIENKKEKNTNNATLTIKRLKNILNIKTDSDLSELLNVKANTVSTWKKRDTMDYPAIITLCERYKIDLNEIFIARKSITNLHEQNTETILINREMQFEYCLGNRKTLEGLPRFHFPFITGDESRAFQVVGDNMFPTIKENSYVVCESAVLEEVPAGSMVVLISKTRGLFVDRLFHTSDSNGFYTLISENKFFSQIKIRDTDIDEVWSIKAILSYINDKEMTVETI